VVRTATGESDDRTTGVAAHAELETQDTQGDQTTVNTLVRPNRL
jgi:hypothetical protein